MKQRVVDAIRHTGSGYVPWHMDLTSQFAEKMRKETGCADCEEELGNHLVRTKYKRNVKCGDNQEVDIFGAKWLKGEDGGDIGVVCEYPLRRMSLSEYVFPEIKKDLAEEACTLLENDTRHFRMFGLTMGFFERAWSLRGMEDLLMDMASDEAETQELFDRILEHHLKLLDYVLHRDFDALYFGDDWGQQHGLIMGPVMWRKYIKPGVSKLFERVKAVGKYVVLHSCGDLREIMPEVVDMGVDVYNTVQPEIYDLKTLKRDFGKDLTFYGGISTQQFLPTASKQQCREMARSMIDLMGNGGGYILSPTHAVTPDIPVENIVALAEVAREFNKSF